MNQGIDEKLSKEELIAAVMAEWEAEIERLPEPSTDYWPNHKANEPYWRIEKKYKAKIKRITEEED